MEYQQPDSKLSLRKLEKALRREKEKLELLKKERIVDPFYVSSTVVPSTPQLQDLIINLRNELLGLREQCFFSSEQINAFVPLHSIDFGENLLELHEAEVERLKGHYEENRELFTKVSQRQEVWSKFMELEKRAKDPSR